MRLSHTLSIVILTLASGVSPAREPTDAELREWMLYVRSAGASALVDVCAPLVPNKEEFALAVDNWLKANSDAIARGKEVALSGLPKGQTLDKFNADIVADFKVKFDRQSDAQKTNACAKYIEVFKTTAKE